jgi:predicted dehydrogenase
MRSTPQIHVAVVGGSGFWAGRNHFPSILAMRSRGIPVKVIAIIEVSSQPSLSSLASATAEVIASDCPQWINVSGLSAASVCDVLDQVNLASRVDALIISTPPVAHKVYAEWAVERGVDVLCDKPVLLRSGSSSNLAEAKENWRDFDRLSHLVSTRKRADPSYLFCSALRRRAMPAFRIVADNLADVATRTGQGVTHMTFQVNGGLHRFPDEFDRDGAHGYVAGVGALAHSSYHYLDLIAWYLQSAPGQVKRLEIGAPVVRRVRDYVNTGGYLSLLGVIDPDHNSGISAPVLSDQILDSELDVVFVIRLLDLGNHSVGMVVFSSNHTSYSPRQNVYDPTVVDPANDRRGGRMSQMYADIHQGPLQQFQFLKNDEVFTNDIITLRHRLHPLLGASYHEQVFQDAYGSSPVTTGDLVSAFLLRSVGWEAGSAGDLLVDLDAQRLTYRLFSSMYEQVASNLRKSDLPDAVVKIDLA